MSATEYELAMDKFNIRFRPLSKLQDIFGRQYLICQDNTNSKKIICKKYSVESIEQKNDVLENMANFIKLNSIYGISNIIAYAEHDSQLNTAFECDGKMLSEFLQQLLNQGNKNKHKIGIQHSKPLFYKFYIFLMKELIKIVNRTVTVGMQLDDISRDNIIIYEPSMISSSSSIEEDLSSSIKILFDERQKDYEILLNPYIFPKSNEVKRFPNKLYWSSQKILSQIIYQEDYVSEDGLQSVYQIGLLLLDIVYQCENFQTDCIQAQKQSDKSGFQLIDPDAHLQNIPQLKRGYYQINKIAGTVQRDEAFIAHKLNSMINSEQQILKNIGILIKNMIISVPQMRYDLLKVQRQSQRIAKLLDIVDKEHQTNSYLNIDQNKQETFSFRLQQKNTVKNSYESDKSSNLHIQDSLKYSENSLGFNEQFISIDNDQNSKFLKNTDALIGRKQIQIPLSSTTITQSPNRRKFQTANTSNTSKTCISNENIEASERKIINEEQQYQNSRQNNETCQSIRQINNSNQITREIMKSCKCSDLELVMKLQQLIIKINGLSMHSPSAVIRKQYMDGSYYYGCFDKKSNMRTGQGIYTYKAGDIYFGQWNRNSLPAGTFLFKNGESYIGPINNGKQGEGTYKYSNGNIYAGEWKDDLKSGHGTMNYANGARYQGEWIKGKKHGVGYYYYQNGLEYHGGFVLGKKYGNGIFTFTNGTKIHGFWENNCLEGKAVVQYYNGDRFEGNFYQSQKSGQGKYQWKVGQNEEVEYSGDFKKDHLDGHACIKFQNGQSYQGNIKNGKREGDGSYYYKNGDEFTGIWKQDKKQIGKYIFQSGETFEGKFKNGQMSFGTLQYTNGESYQGQFWNGERHGVGNYSTKQKKVVYEGRWDRDQFIGEGIM